jgi:glycosyltransferase involved in cell wall biosynthesis
VHLSNWLVSAQPLLSVADLSISLLVDPGSSALPAVLDGYAQVPLELPPYTPRSIEDSVNFDLDAELVFDSAFEAFLLNHRFDLFHNTYPVAAEYFSPRRVQACPTVVSLYDTILLRYHTTYLRDFTRRQRLSFAERLATLLRASRVQTLTAASAEDIALDIGVPPERIDVVSCGVSDEFSPLSRDELTKRLSRLGVSPGYLLAVSSTHFSKNLEGLLRAYALLSADLCRRHPLVAVLPLSPEVAKETQRLTQELDIERHVRFHSSLSQEALVALYNGAAMLVHASLYEGFGLPVVEAMRCGTPVVCSDTSSLPEAGGEAVAYFDPAQPDDIARVITSVLTSPEHQTTMRERGFVQAARFTWDKVAQAVLASYQRAIDADNVVQLSPSSPKDEPVWRIAYWSPLPPQPSGISDYSESLLERLKILADIDVFVDGYYPDHFELFDDIDVFDYRAFPTLHACRPYDACLYQLGNSPFHAYMYPTLLASPCLGIGVFHDGTLFYLLKHMLSSQALVQEIGYSEGKHAMLRALAQQSKGKIDDCGYPLLRRAAQACAGIITHSEFVARRSRTANPDASVQVIPFGTEYYDEDDGRFQAAVRNVLGLPQGAVIFGVFGRMHPVKRIQKVLAAFLMAGLEDCYLYLVGEIDEYSPAMLRDLALDLPRARQVNVFIENGYPPYERLVLAMHAVDVGINLRYPTTGETSATLCGLLGMGKPVIVSDVGAFAEFPDDCVIKVPVSDSDDEVDSERIALIDAIRNLVYDATLRRRMAQAAREYSWDRTWDRTARQYISFIEQVSRIKFRGA